jgi:BASS family bile acid:Na+ symporter
MAALKFIIPITIALVTFTQGLGISPTEVLKFFKERPGLMLRSFVACLVFVPAAAVAIILILKPSPAVAVGLAILVSCPPAPLMLQTATKLGKGSGAYMASIHLSFAALAFLTVPAVLYVISQPLGFHAYVDLRNLLWTLGRTILLPVGIGLILRGVAPDFSEKIIPIVSRVTSIGMLITVVAALMVLVPTIIRLDAYSYLVIACVSITALAIGHLLGPPDPHEKTVLAVETGTRHPVLALGIASMNFTPERALPVMGPCILTFIVIAIIYMVLRGKRTAAVELAGSVS